MRHLAALLSVCVLTVSGAAQPNCAGATTGRLPLRDLGAGTYQGFTGGLYPGGANTLPVAHLTEGIARAQAMEPLDASGAPDPNGRVVLLAVGMSNTTIEFARWMPFSDQDPQRNASVELVDGAQGSWDAYDIGDPNTLYWSNIEERLGRRHLTPEQVQIVWLKQAEAQPTLGFPDHALALRDQLKVICNVLVSKYPNLKICYVSDRTYGGYTTTPLNPEPWAYETSFAVKWLIEAQINGFAGLNYDPAAGPVKAPWLCWGPELWADGMNVRSDGLFYACDDFREDGTHPYVGVCEKVGGLLSDHFQGHATAAPWYVGQNGVPPGGVRAQSVQYGSARGCAEENHIIDSEDTPWLGNPAYQIDLGNGVPGTAATLFVSLAPDLFDLGGYCASHISLAPEDLLFPNPSFPTTVTVDSLGRAALSLSIPDAPGLEGRALFSQWMSLSTGSPGGFYTTNALESVLGSP